VLQQHRHRHLGRQLSQSGPTRIAEKWLAAIDGLAIPGISRFSKAGDILDHALFMSGAIVL
jgi:hypothetical protein